MMMSSMMMSSMMMSLMMMNLMMMSWMMLMTFMEGLAISQPPRTYPSWAMDMLGKEAAEEAVVVVVETRRVKAVEAEAVAVTRKGKTTMVTRKGKTAVERKEEVVVVVVVGWLGCSRVCLGVVKVIMERRAMKGKRIVNMVGKTRKEEVVDIIIIKPKAVAAVVVVKMVAMVRAKMVKMVVEITKVGPTRGVVVVVVTLMLLLVRTRKAVAVVVKVVVFMVWMGLG